MQVDCSTSLLYKSKQILCLPILYVGKDKNVNNFSTSMLKFIEKFCCTFLRRMKIFKLILLLYFVKVMNVAGNRKRKLATTYIYSPILLPTLTTLKTSQNENGKDPILPYKNLNTERLLNGLETYSSQQPISRNRSQTFFYDRTYYHGSRFYRKTSNDIRTCFFTPTEIYSARYFDGMKVNEIVYECKLQWQYCCELECCTFNFSWIYLSYIGIPALFLLFCFSVCLCGRKRPDPIII